DDKGQADGGDANALGIFQKFHGFNWELLIVVMTVNSLLGPIPRGLPRIVIPAEAGIHGFRIKSGMTLCYCLSKKPGGCLFSVRPSVQYLCPVDFAATRPIVRRASTGNNIDAGWSSGSSSGS
ncbi:MAG: hypothetical protein RQ753_10635, partial [Desulfurivibrionaceae bacterium]|nr:hypothetical protein [Desulfurivibrionaceae bacterium]